MKSKTRLLLSISMLVPLLITACLQPDLLRYGNRATSLGFFGSGSYSRGYHFPVRADYARLVINHHKTNHVIVKDKNDFLQLHVLNPGTGEIEQEFRFPFDRVRGVALSGSSDVIAINRGFGPTSKIFLYPFGAKEQPDHQAVIEGAERPIWHPSKPLLAGIYFPKGYEFASNIIALFDTSGSNPSLTNTFELEYLAISQLLGWSSNGQVIAVSQYDEIGEIPYYIFPDENGAVRKSLFRQSQYNCVTGAQWSPNAQIMAFSGENSATEGRDIFLETVVPPERNDGSLVNLTNTPREDELDPAWSLDGKQLVYVKGYEDAASNLRQDLFIISTADTWHRPVQLTDTPDEFEANPFWISDSEIAYLSWSPMQLVWTLNTVSTIDHVHKRVMEIPQSWYQLPSERKSSTSDKVKVTRP